MTLLEIRPRTATTFLSYALNVSNKISTNHKACPLESAFLRRRVHRTHLELKNDDADGISFFNQVFRKTHAILQQHRKAVHSRATEDGWTVEDSTMHEGGRLPRVHVFHDGQRRAKRSTVAIGRAYSRRYPSTSAVSSSIVTTVFFAKPRRSICSRGGFKIRARSAPGRVVEFILLSPSLLFLRIDDGGASTLRHQTRG